MKNDHGVEPTRFMKRKDISIAICCHPNYGPIFGDMSINTTCNEEDSCFIFNDGTNSYECHPKYKSSLFVNTAGPNYRNDFTVLDYEVYTHN